MYYIIMSNEYKSLRLSSESQRLYLLKSTQKGITAKEMKLNKPLYADAEIEVIFFSAEDIVTASSLPSVEDSTDKVVGGDGSWD